VCRVHYMSQACGTGGGGVFSVYHSLDNSDSCPTVVAHFLFPIF